MPRIARNQMMPKLPHPSTSKGHDKGPYAPQTRKAVKTMDKMMRALYGVLQALPISEKIDFIVTSDHGMTRTSPERVIRLSDYVKSEWIHHVDYSVPSWLDANKVEANGVVLDYTDSIIDALKDVPHLHAWRRSEVPAYLQFGTNENIGDVILNTRPCCSFCYHQRQERQPL